MKNEMSKEAKRAALLAFIGQIESLYAALGLEIHPRSMEVIAETRRALIEGIAEGLFWPTDYGRLEEHDVKRIFSRFGAMMHMYWTKECDVENSFVEQPDLEMEETRAEKNEKTLVSM